MVKVRDGEGAVASTLGACAPDERLLCSPSADILADARDGNTFAGVELGGRLIERGEESSLFCFRHERLFLRLKPGGECRFLVSRQTTDSFLDLGDRAHLLDQFVS